MPVRVYACLLVTMLATWMACCADASAQRLFKRFLPVDQVAADPDSHYTLSQENGPWLIMAATFSDEGAEEEARALALEFRRRFNLPAFVHDMAFDFSEAPQGRGIDKYGAPLRQRYQRGSRIREWAVLVGEFPAVDDPHAQRLLEEIKSLEPSALTDEEAEESRSEAHRFRKSLLTRMGKSTRGPMSKAFLVPNPLLPPEYFTPSGVDDFVAKMNEGVEHSLLDCPGRHTVKVATFRGQTTLLTNSTSQNKSSRRNNRRKTDPLVEAAENAHLLTSALRAKGWEAYEFHDRNESMVTIGSFDEVATTLPDGRTQPTHEVQTIIQTFGAAYEMPTEQMRLKRIGPQGEKRAEQKVAEVKQQFNRLFAGQHGQVARGLNPKFIEALPGRFIPLDVHPHTIEVPRESISGAYVRR